MGGEFITHRGALFKRKPEGGYETAVYCPHCKRNTSALAEDLCFYCPYCNWRSDFTGRDLPTVMETLPDAGACV